MVDANFRQNATTLHLPFLQKGSHAVDDRASGKRFAARLLVPRLYESDVRPSYNTYVSKIQIRRIIRRNQNEIHVSALLANRLERASTCISESRNRESRNDLRSSIPTLI